MLKMGKVLRKIWMCIAVVLLVLALLWLGRAAYRIHGAKQVVQSASNLRDLGGALLRYASDNGGRYPDRLGDLFLYDPTLGPELFIVPWGSATADTGATAQELAANLKYRHCSYVYLGAGRTTSDFRDDDVLMFDADGTSPSNATSCLYGDGRVELDITAEAIQNIIATQGGVKLASRPSTAMASTLPATAP